MPTTGSGKFPYPNSSAVPDVPADVLLLAQRIDKVASGWTVCADATARAALVTNSDAYEGMHVYQLDTKVEYIYLSSAWVPFHSDWITWATAPTNVVVGTGGAASSVQKYKYVAGRLAFNVRFVLGTTGFSVTGQPAVTLPLSIVQAIAGAGDMEGVGNIYDTSAATAYRAKPRQTSATSVIVSSYSAGSYGGITASTPMTWAAGDVLAFEFWADPV